MALVCVCRFVDEMVTAGVLRLFEVFLGDGPTLTLLVRDDVWGRSEDWRQQIMGVCSLISSLLGGSTLACYFLWSHTLPSPITVFLCKSLRKLYSMVR